MEMPPYAPLCPHSDKWGCPPMCHSALETICDELLSNFAFEFNLRRYIEAFITTLQEQVAALRFDIDKLKAEIDGLKAEIERLHAEIEGLKGEIERLNEVIVALHEVGRCRLTLSNPRQKRLELSKLTLNAVSCFQFCFNLGFKFNLRHYNEEAARLNALNAQLQAGPYPSRP